MTSTEHRTRIGIPVAHIHAALSAVVAHMTERDLPVPNMIEPIQTLPVVSDAITVYTVGSDWERWVESIVVIDETVEQLDSPGPGVDPYHRCSWSGTLPDTGVRVRVIGFRAMPATRLTVVDCESLHYVCENPDGCFRTVCPDGCGRAAGEGCSHPDAWLCDECGHGCADCRRGDR